MSTLPSLNDRAQQLLKLLVERYIDEGQPVGSRALSKDAGLNLSPATIRNVMADLEDLGLIKAPHTSAGRMPTATGYRFFVDSLLTIQPLREDLVQRLRSDLSGSETPAELLETASRLLSEASHMAGVVSLPRRDVNAFEHIEFLPLADQRVLVILVTKGQDIQNKIITLPRPLSPAELQSAANFLNATCVGRDLGTIRQRLLSQLQETRDRVSREAADAAEIAEVALNEQPRPRKPVVVSGEFNLFDFADLASMDTLRGVFDSLHRAEELVGILDRCIDTPGVKLYIGEESGFPGLDACSLVTASYSVRDRIVGAIGVIGPTRMEYEKVIPLVDVTAKLLGAALNSKSLSPTQA